MKIEIYTKEDKVKTFLEKFSSVLFDAFWGKLSILCFVTVIAGTAISKKLDPEPFTTALVLCYLLMLCVPLGYLFGIISTVQKEVPKCYRYCGFFLNYVYIFPG